MQTNNSLHLHICNFYFYGAQRSELYLDRLLCRSSVVLELIPLFARRHHISGRHQEQSQHR